MWRARLALPAAAAATALAGYAYHTSTHRHGKAAYLDAAQGGGAVARYPQPANRQQMLSWLKSGKEYDMAVIGGGASGVSVALDAASRGLKVALFEADDFSSGTSSRSTKLLHGGLRYLKMGVFNLDIEQFKVVKEAIHERGHFFDQAPHISSQLPLMLPVYNTAMLAFYWIGIKMYDMFSDADHIKPSYIIGRDAVLAEFPALKRERLVGAVVYYDGQQDDSRMNVALALTAAAHGAHLLNHARVTKLLKSAEGEGAVCTGVRVRDTLTGEEFDVRAKAVVNAAGPFADEIRHLDDPNAMRLHETSSGVHLVLPTNYGPKKMGLIQFVGKNDRVIFVLPWHNRVVVGTTDVANPVSAMPTPSAAEVDQVIREYKSLVDEDWPQKVTDESILSAWVGFRPLLAKQDAKNTASLPRGHVVTHSPSQLVNILGGKWTTCRALAEDAVDYTIRLRQLSPSQPCHTDKIAVFGSQAYSPTQSRRLQQTYNLPEEIADHLSETYGDRVEEVLSLQPLASPSEQAWNAERVVPEFPYLKSEVVYAVRNEWACTVVDMLARRFRLAFLDTRASERAISTIADAMGKELQWDQSRKAAEIDQALRFLKTMRPSASPAQTQ